MLNTDYNILIIQLSEMLDVIPLPSGCPMTTTRKGRRYLATVVKGEAINLQGDKSDVRLQIDKGCPKRAYLMEVRTDLSKFRSNIPDNECFISPIVKITAPAKTSTSSYTLRIPHCLDEDDDRTKVRVRIFHENRRPTMLEVPKGNDGPLYYNIDARFIELHTTHFCHVVCTICETPYHCLKRINSMWFATFDTEPLTGTQEPECPSFRHDVEIRPYFGGAQYTIADFQKVGSYLLKSKCAVLFAKASVSVFYTIFLSTCKCQSEVFGCHADHQEVSRFCTRPKSKDHVSHEACKRIHPGLKTQSRHHQESKEGSHKKGLCPSKFKKCIVQNVFIFCNRV